MQPGSQIIIIGGGIIGLATAIELRLLGAEITILCQDFKSAAGRAAAGMLDLCLASRVLYPEWVKKIEAISGVATGYWACGILAPRYIEQRGEDWLDGKSIHQWQLGLNSAVVGGYFYPTDGQVDNRALIHSLWVASQSLGIKFQDGVSVTEIHHHQNQVTHLDTTSGVMSAEHYILATGAWSQQLLPIPVIPRKGQMMSVIVPPAQLDNLPLQQVLFGEDIYIVPRRDGRVIIGATSEDVGFATNNTLAGVRQLTGNAAKLFPLLKDWQFQEFWWGFRPATPDELPILGASAYQNLTLATGHYRNGVLLTPITAKLISELVWYQQSSELLDHFRWDRF